MAAKNNEVNVALEASHFHSINLTRIPLTYSQVPSAQVTNISQSLPEPHQTNSHTIRSAVNRQPHTSQSSNSRNSKTKYRRRRNHRGAKDTYNMVGYIPPHLRGMASASNPGPQPVTESSISATHISNTPTQLSKAVNAANSTPGRDSQPRDHSSRPAATKEDAPTSALSASMGSAGAGGGVHLSNWTR